jgi:hypothetical protein
MDIQQDCAAKLQSGLLKQRTQCGMIGAIVALNAAANLVWVQPVPPNLP